MNYPSWGFYPQPSLQDYLDLPLRTALFPTSSKSVLPRGLGRSYGDTCLNEEGLLLGSGRLHHLIAFDPKNGVLTCESGLSFDEILKFIVPKGWFLPVTPGTKFITVGGAIANDIHGKNHHTSGNFGHHVLALELMRSNGDRIECSRNQNSDLFYATIGGLGLTGFITWAQFRLAPLASSWIQQEQIQFNSLEEFFELSASSEGKNEFVVSWVDCVHPKKDLRGILIRGNQSSPVESDNLIPHRGSSLKTIPGFFPDWCLNSFSIRIFNELYYRKNLTSHKTNKIHYDPFYYPLDSIHHWNKIYGRRGFLQYQFVVPYKHDNGKALHEIFELIRSSQMGSFLAVLKTFGSIPSEGLLSFPREGVTLALDFPNYGPALLQVLNDCDQIVQRAQGAVYPAKDARMSKESFACFFPKADEFKRFVDPQFSSSFWRRVR